jgi:hypothetical protein
METVNKKSKIYRQNLDTKIKFNTIEEAMDFFLTKEAQEVFKKYCFQTKFQLTDNNKALHWTINYPLKNIEENKSYTEAWNDAKEKLHKKKMWFANEHYPIIDHEPKHLF